MSEVHVIARFRIKEGNLAEFKRIGVTALAMAKEIEPNTMQYDWFLDATQSTCVVMQHYVNMAAFREHIDNFRTTRDKLLELCDLSIEVFGDLVEEEAAFLASFDIKTFRKFQGFVR